jgi:hypothetical protein
LEDWIVQNKDWFLSGAGIFIVSGIFSFLSVFVTLWFKGKGEKKKRKHLQLSEELVKFELPQTGKSIDNSSLSVSYEGSEYKHLCHYTIFLKNTGFSSIENQDLLFSFPKKILILKETKEVSLSSINLTSKKIKNTADIQYRIDRLESGETVSISILINAEDSESIICKPRGVDNIDYIWGKTSSTNDIERLVFFLAIFVFADMVPFVSSAIQGAIVLVSAPLLVKMAGAISNSKKSTGNIVNISGGLHASDETMLNIHQQNNMPNK